MESSDTQKYDIVATSNGTANCSRDLPTSDNDNDVPHASENILHNHPTFFSSQNELSKNNNNNLTEILTPERQKELDSDFHSVLSYLCHASPCFSLQPSGLEKALSRSLSFPSVFVDEEMQRTFNDLVFGEENETVRQQIDVNIAGYGDTNAIEIQEKNELVTSSNHNYEQNREWKDIPIQKEDGANTKEQGKYIPCMDEVDNAQSSTFLDYFEDHQFQEKMKDMLYTHHGNLLGTNNTECRAAESNTNANVLSQSEVTLSDSMVTSQHPNVEQMNDNETFCIDPQREIISFADDNFLDLTQAFHSPRFTYQNDYFKDDNFVLQMKSLWRHYHHSLDDSSINTSTSRQSLSTSRTTNTLSPTQSSSSLASAFSQTYSANSPASVGPDGQSIHELGAHHHYRHNVRSKHFLSYKRRKWPKRGHTISNIVYDSTTFEKLSRVDRCIDPSEIRTDQNNQIEEGLENNTGKSNVNSETFLSQDDDTTKTSLDNNVDNCNEQVTDIKKKNQRSKNRIRSATSGAFNYIKKKRQSRPAEEDMNIHAIMHGEKADNDGSIRLKIITFFKFCL